MQPLSASQLLTIWERGQALHPVQRALALLIAACPETAPDALADLTVGERDAQLLTLREWTFGSDLESVAACPACGEQLELRFETTDIRADAGQGGDLALSFAGYDVRFRLPTSRDLLAVADSADQVIRQRLLKRCLIEVQHTDETHVADDLPLDVEAAIVARMAEADPQADVQIALNCPTCRHAWQATFDIVAFFWSEIEVWALRLLREVHVLASAYGWRESDILALSPWRRQMYLEMVAQ